jgi:hypothetical protein
MLRLMTDKNALQSGANSGAVMNEVAAITPRLIEALVDPNWGRSIPSSVCESFEDMAAIDRGIA